MTEAIRRRPPLYLPLAPPPPSITPLLQGKEGRPRYPTHLPIHSPTCAHARTFPFRDEASSMVSPFSLSLQTPISRTRALSRSLFSLALSLSLSLALTVSNSFSLSLSRSRSLALSLSLSLSLSRSLSLALSLSLSLSLALSLHPLPIFLPLCKQLITPGRIRRRVQEDEGTSARCPEETAFYSSSAAPHI